MSRRERLTRILLLSLRSVSYTHLKKFVESITSRDQDFAQWYTDVVREAKLCDYSSVKGCLNYLQMCIRDRTNTLFG